MNLKGAFTAMVTPFIEGQLDEKGLVANIRRQREAKIAGIVLMGSTGEDATLTEEEQRRVIEIGVSETKGKALAIVGTGSNSTRKTIEKTRIAKELGADLAMVVTPYYNKPTQEGIYRHFEAIAREVDIPLIVYNIQGRTGVNIETSTLLRIAGLKNVAGVKEASGSVSQAGEVVMSVRGRYPDFSVLCGDDALTLPMMAVGAQGIISVVSNLVPERVVALAEAALEARFADALAIHQELMPLFKGVFIEVNPMPIKQAMEFCGLAAGKCRLPLCDMQEETREKLKRILADMGLTA
jgi:4-hydroxy-tetrahydrodipicolinate synthase